MSRFLNKLTIDQYGKIRFAKDFIFQKQMDMDVTDGKMRIWFLDAPAYGNVGDQAIAYGIRRFCKTVFPNAEIVEFQEDNVIRYLSWLKKSVKPSSIIVLQGGGNLGNLYPRYEFIRRTIIRSFPKNKIIIFPQTLYFSNDKSGEYEAIMARKVYGINKRLIVFARDSKSYNKMKKIFPETSIELCPDIVFSLNGLVSCQKRNGIGVCMRNDKEKVISSKQTEKIIEKITESNEEKRMFDTVTDVEYPVTGKHRERFVLDKLREFAACKMVVTDRLHGMIFSYITSTPCVAVANSTGKSYYTYIDWLSASRNVFFVQNTEDDITKPQNVISKDLDFRILKKALQSGMGE